MSKVKFLVTVVVFLILGQPYVPIHAQATIPEFIWVDSSELINNKNYSLVSAGKHPDGKATYICRAPFDDGVHPGKMHLGKCYVSWGGDEHTFDNGFEVLLTHSNAYKWMRNDLLSQKDVFDKGISGGNVYNETLYICRVIYDGQDGHGVHAGKYLPSTGICYIPYGGEELLFSSSNSTFSILINK